MNPGICYLYEYKNNQKLRNVGFMKITSHFRSCILQINARGIPVQTGEPVKIHAFYEKAPDYIVKPIDDIACGDKSIYVKLTTNESSFPDGKSLDNIGGFLLMINGHYYAALSDNASFDTSRIKMWKEPISGAEAETVNIANAAQKSEAGSLDSCSHIAETESVDSNVTVEDKGLADNDIYMAQNVSEEADGYLTDLEPADIVYAAQTMPDESYAPSADSNPFGADVYMTQAAPVDTNISTAETESANDDFYVTETEPADDDFYVTETEAADDNYYVAETSHTDTNISVTEARFIRDTNPEYVTQLENTAAPSDIDAGNLKEQEPRENVRKIQRCDLSILPRKCWNLANNSFLMHGYHNYNHLLLVEEDGHFWLGVPGIYAAREAKAAELFGFPQFTQNYTNRLELSEDERSSSDSFGYWCRYIK